MFDRSLYDVLSATASSGPTLLMGTAYGVNTVKVDGLDGTAELPYINPVDTSDRVLLVRMGDGALLIIGPVTQP